MVYASQEAFDMTTINANVASLFQQQSVNQNSLSDDQKSSIADILSKYDPENLSEEDVEAIKDELKEAGVRPSAELKAAIEEAGFDAEAFRPSGPPPGGPGQAGGPPPGPPPGGESEEASEETLKTIASIFEEYDLENLNEDDLDEIQQRLQEARISLPGAVINQTA
jgi:hypothetical protein